MKLNEVIDKISSDLSKKKDVWFLETLEKHKLIKSGDISNFDLFWLREEMGVRVVTNNDNKTQIYLEDRLIGEWDNKYQVEELEQGDNEFRYKLVTNYWN